MNGKTLINFFYLYYFGILIHFIDNATIDIIVEASGFEDFN